MAPRRHGRRRTSLGSRPGSLRLPWKARPKGIYRRLWHSSGGDLDVAPGAYRVVVACGVVTIGAAPSETLDMPASIIVEGDHLAFSFNEHALAEPASTDRLDALLSNGFQLLASEHGPNLGELGREGTVYVLQRTASSHDRRY